MFKINIIGKSADFGSKWVVYKTYEVATLEIIHFGVERLSQAFTFTDANANARFDPNREYIFEVVSLHENKAMALREASHLRNELNIRVSPNPRFAQIRCVETGAIYQNASEAAKGEGVSQSQLSNHLNNKSGFNTVKGKTYEKIV